MKVKNYLVALTALILGVQSSSAVTEITSGSSYYIQNVSSNLFLCGSNSWGTQGSVTVQGEMFQLDKADDGAYSITDLALSTSNKKFGSNLYTDNAGVNWTIEAVSGEEGVFTIKYNNKYLAQSATAGAHIGYIVEQVTEVTDAAKWYILTADEAIAKLGAATETAPVDASFLIGDANFSRNHSSSVWSVTASNKNLAGGSNNNMCAESWQSTFDINQTLTGIPNGVYKLSAQAALTDYSGFYDGANYPVVYANNSSAIFSNMVGDDISSNMVTLSTAFTAGNYVVGPVSVTVTDGTLKIGVKGTRTDTWCIWDNFQLKYYGAAGSDQLKEELEKKITEAQEITGKMNATVASDLASAIVTAQAASTTDELQSAMTTITNAISAATASIDVYSAISKLISSSAASAATLDDAGKAAYDVSAVQTAYDNGTITDGTSETSALNAALIAAVKSQGVGADYTLALANPDFTSSDISGWDTNGGATPTVDTGNHDCEFYEKTFNLSQTVTGLKKGTYEISFQAFQRPGAAGTDLADNYLADTWTSSAELYTSAENTQVKHICSDWQDDIVSDVTGWFADVAVTPTGGTAHYIPNGMAGGRQWFDAGYYKTTAKAVVTEDGGSFTFGFKGTSSTGCWILFDNFTMKYVSASALVDATESEKLIATAATLESQPMLTTLKNELTSAKTALAADKTNADLYQALSDKVSSAQESVSAYATAAEILPEMKKLTESTNVYTASALKTYYTDPKAKYDAGTLTNEEAAALQNPATVTSWHDAITCDNFLLSAWDTNPDFTDAPYYINTWSVEGETDGSGFVVPFFEYFVQQTDALSAKTLTATVTGLEEGTYEVTALVRTRLNDAGVTAGQTPAGITLQVNNGAAVSVCGTENNANKYAGASVAQTALYIKEVTAVGNVGSDGVLKIKFNVEDGTNVHWLSFKDVNYKKSETTIETIDFAYNGSLCSDYNATVAGSSVYEFTGIYNNEIYGKAVSEIEAGKPYIVLKGSVSLTPKNDGVTAIQGQNYNGFYGVAGNDEPYVCTDNSYMVFYQGTLWYANNSTCSKGHGYFVVSEIPTGEPASNAKRLFGLNSATGINAVGTAQSNDAPVYNLSGQRVSKAQKGIFIVNGKKVVK